MIKWILLCSLFYFFYRALISMLPIFKLNQSIRHKNKKKSIHKKVSKMDIQDAEFDDNIK